MNSDAAAVADVMGGSNILGRQVATMRDLDDAVREGIPKRALDRVLMAIAPPGNGPTTGVQLRNKIVPRATYQKADRLNLHASETTERLARLYVLALSAFQDSNGAARFLGNEHPELNNRVPLEVALTEVGGREVEEVIERGLHGLSGLKPRNELRCQHLGTNAINFEKVRVERQHGRACPGGGRRNPDVVGR